MRRGRPENRVIGGNISGDQKSYGVMVRMFTSIMADANYFLENGCPDCGSDEMIPGSGCVTCRSCGFSPC